MGKRHVVHASTRDAVVERLVEGKSVRALARELGDETLSPALSDIIGIRHNVGRDMEKRIRGLLGLPSREMAPSEVKRAELSKRLAAAGITWTQAMEIALEVVEATNKGEAT